MGIKIKSNKFMTSFVAISLMISVITPTVSGQMSTDFKDVAISEFGYNEVLALTKQGIINGFNDNTFRPSLSIKRAEAAKLLVNSLQVKGDGDFPLFKDVSKTSQWIPYINAAIDHGIFHGYGNGEFGVDTILTREQMASVLVRAYDLKPVIDTAVPLKDLDTASGIHKEDIKTIYQNGITLGFNDQTFRPKEPVNRVTFSVLLHRTLVSQVNVIQDVTGAGVVIDGKVYTFDETLQGLFTVGNRTALTGAKIEFQAEGTKISKVSNLELNSLGAPGVLVEFDSNVILDLEDTVISGDVTVNGDYFTLKNGSIDGSLTISSDVKNDFYMSDVIVKGGTYVNGGDSNTVVFDHSILSDIVVEKLDVRVKFTGQTSVSTVTVNSNSVIDADSNIIVPLVTIGKNVEKVVVHALITELSLLGNQKVTLEGLTNVGKLTLPIDVKAEDVIANFETIKSVFTAPSDGGSSEVIVAPAPAPVTLPMYEILDRDFEDAKESFVSSQTPYYYSSASVGVYLKVLREQFPTAKTFKVNYLPADLSAEGITKDMYVFDNIHFASKLIPNILKEFNLNETTVIQFNIQIFDEAGTQLGILTDEQLVNDLTADIELAFEGLKGDWTNITFENIRPFIEKSRDMNSREIEMFVKEVKLLENPTINDVNVLAEEILLADLPLKMYTSVPRYIEPLQVGSLLNGYENREVLSITSKDSSMLEVKLGQNPNTLMKSYEIIAHTPGEVDLEVVFKNGTTTETKTIHVEIGILSDTLTEINKLILENSYEISVNSTYLAYVMKHVLETSTELSVSPSFLNHYRYLFNFVRTPSWYTHYDTIEALQNEINQITEEVAPLDSFDRVAPFVNPISFNAATQKEFDVLGYLQGTEFGVFMSDPRLNYFYIEPTSRMPLPNGITLESGKLIISDAFVGSETTVTLNAKISFGEYVKYGMEFRVGLNK